MDESQLPGEQASRPGPVTAGAFIGRQREMRVLTAALEDVLAGRGRLVMLAGEPGIGKTRTAQELTTLAQARGAQVFWGWCYEQQGAPPYWPWLQPIRSYIHQKDAEQLRLEMGPGAPEISEICPSCAKSWTVWRSRLLLSRSRPASGCSAQLRPF